MTQAEIQRPTFYRAWVNQPSTLQPLHALHGTRCIVEDNGEQYVRVWFTEGDVHSMGFIYFTPLPVWHRLCIGNNNEHA